MDLNNGNAKKSSKGNMPFKFLGMMGICCLLPIVIIGLLPLIQLSGFVNSNLILGLSSLICPIMMVGMMIFMFKDGKNKQCCSGHQSEESTNEIK